MSDTLLVAVCTTVLGLMQAYLAYRLNQQDRAREAAKAEQQEAAVKVKEEALSAARAVEAKVDDAAKKVDAAQVSTDLQLGEIHVLVNTRLTEALLRVQALEEKLGLVSGQEIPGPPTITEKTDPPAKAPTSRRPRKKSA